MWDKKYRPLRFSDVLGQPGTVAILKARLRNGTAIEASYLFSGGSGMGKTTLARIMARAMLCLQLNKEDPEPCNECENCKAFLEDKLQAFTERDAASQGTIEHARRITEELPFAVFGAPKRVYLFDECHRMSKDAQDVLLKPVEEKQLVGMFCTTEPEKVRAAIRSRCEEYTIRRATREEVLAWVKRVLVAESVEHEDDAVLTVIDFAGGHIRDVLNRLEMIAQGGSITVDRVRDQLGLGLVTNYYEILLRLTVDLPGALKHLDQVCERVTPEEASTGLAEAAMNAFRLANGMMADFSFTDRNMAAQIHELYKDQLVKIAEYFLRGRHLTNVGLVCDLASLSRSLNGGQVIGAPVQASMPFVPIQVVMAPMQTLSTPASQLTPEPPQAQAEAAAPPETLATVTAPAAAPPPATVTYRPQTLQDKLRTDSHLPTATTGAAERLTVFDGHVVKVPAKQVIAKPAKTDTKENRVKVSPESWKRMFDRLMHVGARRG